MPAAQHPSVSSKFQTVDGFTWKNSHFEIITCQKTQKILIVIINPI